MGAWQRVAPVIERSFAESTLADVTPKILPTHEAEIANLRGAAILVLQRRSSAIDTSRSKNSAAEAGTARARRS